MSFPFSEHPNDDDMPVSVPAPELGPNGTIEVQAIYGAGQVMLSFLSPCSSYEVSLSVETVDALLSALKSEIATAAEFADREEGVFVETPLIACLPDVPELEPLDITDGRKRLTCPECDVPLVHRPDTNAAICANPFCSRMDTTLTTEQFMQAHPAFEGDEESLPASWTDPNEWDREERLART